MQEPIRQSLRYLYQLRLRRRRRAAAKGAAVRSVARLRRWRFFLNTRSISYMGHLDDVWLKVITLAGYIIWVIHNLWPSLFTVSLIKDSKYQPGVVADAAAAVVGVAPLCARGARTRACAALSSSDHRRWEIVQLGPKSGLGQKVIFRTIETEEKTPKNKWVTLLEGNDFVVEGNRIANTTRDHECHDSRFLWLAIHPTD